MLSCIVSVVSIVVKAMLFFTKIRTRDIAHKIGKRRATIGGVDISSELSDNEAVKELKARFDEHRMEQRRFVRSCAEPLNSWRSCWLPAAQARLRCCCDLHCEPSAAFCWQILLLHTAGTV